MSNEAQRVGSRGPYSTSRSRSSVVWCLVLYGALCYMVPRDPTLSALLLIQHIEFSSVKHKTVLHDNSSSAVYLVPLIHPRKVQ